MRFLNEQLQYVSQILRSFCIANPSDIAHAYVVGLWLYAVHMTGYVSDTHPCYCMCHMLDLWHMLLLLCTRMVHICIYIYIYVYIHTAAVVYSTWYLFIYGTYTIDTVICTHGRYCIWRMLLLSVACSTWWLCFWDTPRSLCTMYTTIIAWYMLHMLYIYIYIYIFVYI